MSLPLSKTQNSYLCGSFIWVTNAALTIKSAGFSSEANADGTKLRLVRDMKLTGERVKAAEYPEFRETALKAAAVSQQQWKIKVAAAPAPAPAAPAPDAPKDGAGGK